MKLPFLLWSANAVALVRGNAYIDTLPFDVMIAKPRNPFATRPSEDKCDKDVLTAISDCLSMDPDQVRTGIAKFIKALSGNSVSIEKFASTFEEKASERRLDHLPSIFRAQNKVEAFLNTINIYTAQSFLNVTQCARKGDTSCAPEKDSQKNFTDGGMEIRLDYLPDLLLGFLSGPLASNIIADTLGQNAPAFDWIGLFGINLKSPMINLGTSICSGTDMALARDFDRDWATCGLLTILNIVMGCAETPITCDAPSAAPDLTPCDRFPQPDGPVDLSLTPAADVTAIAELADAEGRQWLYRWAACRYSFDWGSKFALCGAPPPTLEFVPGWTTKFEVWAELAGSTALESAVVSGTIPVLTLAEKKGSEGEGCEFLVVLRGTATRSEWAINFDSRQLPLTDGPEDVRIHGGYAGLADAMLPLFRHWLDTNRFDNGQCDISKTTFHFTGHSLGGAMAQVMSLKTALHYQPLGASVDVVAFAPAHAMNTPGYELLTELVNVRTIVQELDIVPEFPCANKHGIPRCNHRKCAGKGASGRDEPYGRHPNVFTITKEKVGSYTWPETDKDGNPVVDEDGNPVIFKTADLYNNSTLLSVVMVPPGYTFSMASPLQFGANHVCAYECFLTAEFCFTDVSKAYSCACNPVS